MSAMRAAIIFLVGLLGLYATLHPTFNSGFTRMQPEGGDVVLNNYFLEHTYRWAFDKEYSCSFWSPSFFYPTPLTFTYSETLIGLAPVYWLLRTFCSESVAAQWWIVIMLVLNYGAMAIVLRWFRVSLPLTIAGAYLFAFGSLRTDHLTHQQLFPHVFGPFAVWSAWQFLLEPTTRRWATLMALIGAQLLASLHLGWFTWFGIAVLMSATYLTCRQTRQQFWQFIRQRPFGAILPVVIVGAILGAYAKTFYQGAPERRDYGSAIHYMPFLDGWLVMPKDSLYEDHLSPRADGFDEVCLFHGFTAYAVMIIAALHAYRQPHQRRFILLFIGTAFFLALSVTRFPGNLSLWFFVHTLVPGANAFRAIGRIALIAIMFGSIGGFTGFQGWLEQRRWCSHTKQLVAWLVLLLILVEQARPTRTSFDKQDECYGPALQAAELMRGADVAYIRYDESMPDYRHHITAMWAGMHARVPVMNGFSGTQPPDYPAYMDQPSINELVGLLGPEWEGTLVIIDWHPLRKTTYRIQRGADPAKRITRVQD